MLNDEVLKSAEAHIANNNVDKAIEVLLVAEPQLNKSATAYQFLAKCYELQGNLDKAISCYCSILEIQPEQAETIDNLSRLYNLNSLANPIVNTLEDEDLSELKLQEYVNLAKKSIKNIHRFLDIKFIYFDITNYCNYRCMHCGFASITWTNADFNKNIISLTDFKRWLAKIDKGITRLEKAFNIVLNRKDITIHPQGGGEPLLHPNFPELIEEITKYGFSTRISTNASLLSGKRADALAKSNLKDIHFSLDAASPELYAKFRKGGNHAKVYKQCLDFLNAISHTQHAYTTVSFCYTPYNYQECKQFIEFWLPKVYLVWIQQYYDPNENNQDLPKPLLPARGFCRYLGNFMIGQTGEVIGCMCGFVKAGNISTQSFESIMLNPERIKLYAMHESGDFAAEHVCASCERWYQEEEIHHEKIRVDRKLYDITTSASGINFYNYAMKSQQTQASSLERLKFFLAKYRYWSLKPLTLDSPELFKSLTLNLK